MKQLLYFGELFAIGLFLPRPLASTLFALFGLILLFDHLLYKQTALRFRLFHLIYLRHPASFFHSAKNIPTFLFGSALILISATLDPILFGGLLFLFGGKENSVMRLQADLFRVHKKKAITPLPISGENYTLLHPDYPLLRTTWEFLGEKKLSCSLKKPNVIFLFLESFRAKNVGALGSTLPLSPAFDQLSQEGILFTNFHSTGNLSCRALIASLFGVSPTSLDWPLSRYVPIPLIGAPEILKNEGYKTVLMQGGHLSFENSLEFYQTHHFDTVLGKRDFEKKGAKSTSWGVYDEYLFREAAQFLEQEKAPTFLTLCTITNHHPWKKPPHFAPPKETAGNPFLETFSYTDWALGNFVQDLKAKGLLDNTLLFVFGDHGQEDNDAFEVNRNLTQETLHIPLLILGNVEGPKRIETVASQIDLLPTLLDLLNLHVPHHSLGKSLAREVDSTIYFAHPPRIGGRKGDFMWEGGEEIEEYYKAVDALFENRKFSPKKIEKKEKPHLEFLNSVRLRDPDLEELGTTHPNALSLSLSWCHFISDAGVEGFLKNTPGLEILSLVGLEEIKGALWPNLPQLAFLEITHSPNLEETAFFEWLLGLKSLRNLKLEAPFLNDHHLERMGIIFQDLWTLQLFNAPNITDSGLKALIEANPALRALELEDCPQIGDGILEALQKTSLRILSLENAKVTDQGLEKLKGLPLKRVTLKRCPGVANSLS